MSQPLPIRVPALRPAIADAYKRGYSLQELEKHFAMNRKTIRKALVVEGITLRSRGRRPLKDVPPPLEV